jgi:hypothetical protein
VDAGSLRMLEDTLRKTMATATGYELDRALGELGWLEMLDETPEAAIPLVFRLLGETGAHASVLNDVVRQSGGRDPGETVPLPYAGGAWVVWQRTDSVSESLDGQLTIYVAADDLSDRYIDPAALAAGRRALGWWLVGTSRAMLSLARRHALDRVQFGRPVAGFQAIRHRLAEALVAIEGAEATLQLTLTEPDHLSALLAKAAAGQAASTAARHCQQVLGGIGFTAEHALHQHVKRALLLDGLLGSARELTREAGTVLRERGSASRLAQL